MSHGRTWTEHGNKPTARLPPFHSSHYFLAPFDRDSQACVVLVRNGDKIVGLLTVFTSCLWILIVGPSSTYPCLWILRSNLSCFLLLRVDALYQYRIHSDMIGQHSPRAGLRRAAPGRHCAGSVAQPRRP